MDDAVEPFFESGRSEVDEQTDREIHQAKIGQHLLAMHRCMFLNGLPCHEDASVHSQVNPQPVLKDQAVTLEADDLLTLHMQPASRESLGEHQVVHRFQQFWAQTLMDV